jgi:gamma-aminobutyric acid type B receptor
MSLETNKFDVVASQSFNDEITGQLDAMLEKDVRIILGNFNESWARYFYSS